MVINQIALRSPGGVQRGPAPSGGGLRVSPRFLKRPLGRAGGKNNAHVAVLPGKDADAAPAHRASHRHPTGPRAECRATEMRVL